MTRRKEGVFPGHICVAGCFSVFPYATLTFLFLHLLCFPRIPFLKSALSSEFHS